MKFDLHWAIIISMTALLAVGNTVNIVILAMK